MATTTPTTTPVITEVGFTCDQSVQSVPLVSDSHVATSTRRASLTRPKIRQRIGSEQKKSWRRAGFDGLDDGGRGLAGVARLCAVDGVVFLATLACGIGVVVDHRRGLG